MQTENIFHETVKLITHTHIYIFPASKSFNQSGQDCWIKTWICQTSLPAYRETHLYNLKPRN